MQEADRKLLRLIAAGGLWTGKHAQQAGFEAQPLCRLCGEPTETMIKAHRHIYWERQKAEEFRRVATDFPEGFDHKKLRDLMACHAAAPALYL